MDFQKLSKISGLFSKTFAEDFLRLLVQYTDISASEAASRLDQHIKTAQDFLEGLADLEIVTKKEVTEGKRPYYRYTLIKPKFSLEVNLSSLYDPSQESKKLLTRIREKKNAGVMFTTSGTSNLISSVVILIGEGRKRKERKISLTKFQGRFLFYLPFPNTEYVSVREVMEKSDLDLAHTAEILDLVDTLIHYKVIEVER
jgi:predicted transcriptional regulator